MNILILTGRFGMGHYSVSEALLQDIKKHNKDTNITIVDFIDYMFPNFSGAIYNVFNSCVSKFSFVYNLLSKIGEKHNSLPFKKVTNKKLKQLLNDIKPDLIISNFPVFSQCVSSYKQAEHDSILLYTYVTDIFVHEEWIAPKINLYFVGSESTKNALISKGVDEDKILISGIPVRKEFLIENKNIRRNKKNLLIMGGGLGLMPTSFDFLNKLSQFNITIITGKNEKLKQKLQNNFPFVEVLGYVNNVSDYMRKADLLITKSGGVTIFEALHCKTPLYIIKPFLMQEKGNAEYIAQNNIGRVVWSRKTDIASDILNLLNNNSLLEVMKQNMSSLTNELDNSCYNVYQNKGQL